MESTPDSVSYLYKVKVGNWLQQSNGEVDILFLGGAVSIGRVGEKLDQTQPLRIIVEAHIAKSR